MNYFYGTRLDRQKNVLMTSYSSKVQLEKHAKDAKHEHTVYRIDLETGQIDDDPDFKGAVLRSININKGEIKERPTQTLAQPYKVYVKENGKWRDYGEAFAEYGRANNLMKEIVYFYEAAAVIDTEARPLKSQRVVDDNIDLDIRG